MSRQAFSLSASPVFATYSSACCVKRGQLQVATTLFVSKLSLSDSPEVMKPKSKCCPVPPSRSGCCTDGSQTFCATAFTSSQHLIPDKEAQLKALLQERIDEEQAVA